METNVIRPNEDLKIADFGVDAVREDMSVSTFMDRQRDFKFNDPIQRNADAWSIQKKSMLIVSAIERVHIGEIKAQVIRENKKKIRNVIDGKQRCTTLRDYKKINLPSRERSILRVLTMREMKSLLT